MNISKNVKTTIIIISALATCIASYLVYALAGIGAQPVLYSAPPEFVATYADNLNYSEVEPVLGTDVTDGVTKDLTAQKELVHKVFLEGPGFDNDDLNYFLALFTHPDKTQRIKIAAAFAYVNITYSHNEESGYPDKRRLFWEVAKPHLHDIENALFEAMIATAEEKTNNRIPYTLAWMPTQDQETTELLAGTAKHHPDPWVRRFSVYFVVAFGGIESFAEPLMSSSVHDPAYIVRKQVLDLKWDGLFK